jgi:hypothetical protein
MRTEGGYQYFETRADQTAFRVQPGDEWAFKTGGGLWYPFPSSEVGKTADHQCTYIYRRPIKASEAVHFL